MKTLMISFAFYLFSGINMNFVELPAVIDDVEIVDRIKVKADSATYCNKKKCIVSMKEKAKSFEKLIVLYKAGSKWVVERDSKKCMDAIESYEGSDIAIWQGNLKLENVALSDEVQIVALN